MVGRRDRDQTVEHERRDLHADRARRIGHHGQIAGPLREPAEDAVSILDVERDVDPGMRPMERPEGRGNDVDPGCGVGGDVDRSPGTDAQLGKCASALVQPVKDVVARLHQDVSGGGQLDTSPTSIEQVRTQFTLERLHLVRHRRLGDRQLAGGRRVAAEAGHREEEAQTMEIPADGPGARLNGCRFRNVRGIRHVLDSMIPL